MWEQLIKQLKSKKLLTLSLSATMILAMSFVTTTHANELNDQDELLAVEESGENKNSEILEQNETLPDVETTELSQNEDVSVQSSDDEVTAQADEASGSVQVGETVDNLEKLADQSTVTRYDDGWVKTRTWDVPVNIEINGKSQPFDSSSWSHTMGGLEALESSKEAITYTFNKPVNIVVDGCQGTELQLIRRDMTSTYGSWIFNAPVTFTIKNSNFDYIQCMQVYASGGEFYSERNKKWGVQMNDTYTINVENCQKYSSSSTGIEFIGGSKKMTVRQSSADVTKDEWKAGVQKGLNINLKNTNVYSFTAGHYLINCVDKTNPDFFMNGDINVTLDNSNVLGSFNSSIGMMALKDSLDINGKVNVKCINGSQIRVFYANGATYTSAVAIGKVSGGVTLTPAEGRSMTGLKGASLLNLTSRFDVTTTTEVPANGMKLNLVDQSKWNNGDILFTTSAMYVPSLNGWIYPKVDQDKVTNNWTNPNYVIKYKETKETRNVNFGGNIGTRATDVYSQIWYLERSVTVSYDTDGGSAVNPETVLQGNTVTEPTTTRDHATFDGWYTDKTYQTKWNFNEPVNEDMTLYAKWILNEQTVKVETNGGTKVEDIKVPYGETIKEPTSTKEGYTFDGWYTDKELTTKWDFKEVVKADMTLYAKWKENETPVNPDEPSTPGQPDKPENPSVPENPTVPEKPSNEDKGSTEEIVKPNTEKKEEAKVTSTNKTKKESKKVKTGDQTNILYFMLLTVVSLLMVLILIRQRFKKSFK